METKIKDITGAEITVTDLKEAVRQCRECLASPYLMPSVENPLKVVPLIHSNLTPVKFSHSPFCLFLFSSYSSCPLCRVLH